MDLGCTPGMGGKFVHIDHTGSLQKMGGGMNGGKRGIIKDGCMSTRGREERVSSVTMVGS